MANGGVDICQAAAGRWGILENDTLSLLPRPESV